MRPATGTMTRLALTRLDAAQAAGRRRAQHAHSVCVWVGCVCVCVCVRARMYMYRLLGADVRNLLTDIKPALLATIDEAFAKVSDDTPAGCLVL